MVNLQTVSKFKAGRDGQQPNEDGNLVSAVKQLEREKVNKCIQWVYMMLETVGNCPSG